MNGWRLRWTTADGSGVVPTSRTGVLARYDDAVSAVLSWFHDVPETTSVTIFDDVSDYTPQVEWHDE